MKFSIHQGRCSCVALALFAFAIAGCDSANHSTNSPTAEATPDASRSLDKLESLTGIVIKKTDEQPTSLDFRQCELGWSAQLSELKRLPKLDAVLIAGDEANDDVAKTLSQLSSLRTLAIERSKLTDQGMEAIGNLSKLRSLKVSAPQATDNSLEHIAKLTDLVVLSLQDFAITDDGLAPLAALSKLREVTIFNAPVNSGPLQHLDPATITKLNLRATKLDSNALQSHLAKFVSLVDLEVSETMVDDAGLVPIAALPSLKSLNLLRTKVTDEGLKHLLGTQISRLNLDDNASITDAGAKSLALMTRLEWLHLGKTKVTDVGLAELETLQVLSELLINDTAVTSEAIESLQSKLPKLKKIVR